MGKKSIKENKNIYQISREELNLTREKASEMMEFISADRIEKIESGKSAPHPDEIMVMAKCYKKPELCNYYCTHECEIGKIKVNPVQAKELSQITLEVLNTLNILEKQKERFIEITVDGVISEDEMKDFELIRSKLDSISQSVDSLKLWMDKQVANK